MALLPTMRPAHREASKRKRGNTGLLAFIAEDVDGGIAKQLFGFG